MKQTTKVLLSAVLTIALCLSVISGATFALFTSESSTNIAVNAGTVKVEAEILTNTLKLFSMTTEEQTTTDANGNKLFATGGTATFDTDGNLKLDRVVPGDKVTFDIKVTNSSNVTVAFRTIVDTIADNGLFNGLKVTVGNNTPYTGFTATAWTTETAAFERIVPVTIELPTDAGNEYQGKSCTLNYKVEAVQGNGVDNAYLTVKDGVYQINNATDLKIFSMLVNSGKINETNFNTLATETTIPNGVKAELTTDITNVGPFTPIGTEKNYFVGTFDGNGYTVRGLQVNVNSGAGLFGYAGRYNQLGFQNRLKAEIKNVTVENANIVSNHYAGGIVGYIYGDVVDCTVKNSSVVVVPEIVDGVYDNGDKAGGIAGFADWCNITGNTVDTVLVSAYRDLGGVVGILAANADASLDASVVDLNTVTGGSVAYVTGYVCPNDEQKNISAVVGRQATAVDVIQNNQYATTVNRESVSNNTEVVEDAKELESALNNQADTVLKDDLSFSSKDTASNSGYGATGITVNGGVLDGNGNTLTVNNANGDWDCAVNPKAGTIKNVTVNGAFRGIFMGSATGDVYIDNVIIDKVCYTFNSDGGNKAYGVYISNSTLNGWTSFSDVHKEVVFTNCHFGQGTGSYQYAYCRPYNSPSLFKNCTFSEGFEFDATQTNNITFVDCYVGQTLITAENVVELLGSDAANVKFSVKTASSETLKDSVAKENAYIQLDKGTYTFPASSIKAGVTIECAEGTVFEGNSKLNINGSTVIGATFSNPNGTAVDQTINGTFKDCEFTGYNGLRYCYAGETVVFENCVFSGDLYGVHFDGGANEVVFKNCTFSGFNAMGSAITKATFENCTFVSNGRSGYNGINLWGTTDLINCTFVFDGSASTEWIGLNAAKSGKTITLTGCTVTGTTNDMTEYFANYNAGNTVIVDGETITLN